ncbi:MAG: hypothetical protein M3Q73_00890 [bacterium]|nr:hypothetical protein [bacterium]
MKKKNKNLDKVTLADVLKVTKDSFQHLEDKMATKDDITRLEKRIDVIEGNMATKDDISRIEQNHERRIEILEDDVRVLKTTVEKR